MHLVPEAAKFYQNVFLCFTIGTGLLSLPVISTMMSFTKKLFFSLVCPQDVLAEELWFCCIYFGKLESCFFFMALCPSGSPTIASLFIQTATERADTVVPCLQICLNIFGKFIGVLCPPFKRSFVVICHYIARPGRLATALRSVILLVILHTVNTETWRFLDTLTCNLEMINFSTIFFLSKLLIPLHTFLFFSITHTLKVKFSISPL